MNTDAVEDVVRALVDATDMRMYRTRNVVALWDEAHKTYVRIGMPVDLPALARVSRPLSEGGQDSTVVQDLLQKVATAFAECVDEEFQRLMRESKPDTATETLDALSGGVSQASGSEAAKPRSAKRPKREHYWNYMNEVGDVVTYSWSAVMRNRTVLTAECYLHPWFQRLVFQTSERDGDLDLLNGTLSLGSNSVLTVANNGAALVVRPRLPDDAMLLSCGHSEFDAYATQGPDAIHDLLDRWKAWAAWVAKKRTATTPEAAAAAATPPEAAMPLDDKEEALFQRMRKLSVFLRAAIEKFPVRRYLLYLLFERLVLAVPKECIAFECSANRGKTMMVNLLRCAVGSYAEKRSEDSIKAHGANRTARDLDNALAASRVRFFVHDEAPAIDEHYLLTTTNGTSKTTSALHTYEQRELSTFPMRVIAKNPMNAPLAACNKDLRCKINLFGDNVMTLTADYRILAQALEKEANGIAPDTGAYGPAMLLLLCDTFRKQKGVRPPRPAELYQSAAPAPAPPAAAGTHLHDLRLKFRSIFAEIFETDESKTEYLTMKQVLAAMSAHVGDGMFNQLAQKAFADTMLMAGVAFDGDEVSVPKLLPRAPSMGPGLPRKTNVMFVKFRTEELRERLFVQD